MLSDFEYYCETLPDELRGTAVCSHVPFFRTEIVDYKQLLKECMDESYATVSRIDARYCINQGFKYLNRNISEFENMTGDNEFFRKLFWSVYLHIYNYDERQRFDEMFENDNPKYGVLVECFKDIMYKYPIGIAHPWYYDDVDYLPAFLEKYEIFPEPIDK